jgi:ATP-dependent DNA helicase RecQ
VTIWNASDTKRLHQIATVSFPSLEYIEDIYHKVHVFFDIPYDAGAGRQLKFDLDEFCKRFRLQRQAAYYSIVYIERTGHWTMSEDVDISTKVQISVSRNELYDVEFPDPRMVQLLEILMRKYTGIFSFPVPVDEEYLAGLLDVQVPMLRQILYKLSLEHVIKYIPCDHATVLFLHHERLRPKNVNLDPERYDLLKSSALERMQKMIDYISEEDTCRSAYLLEYFGQKESADCGTCDVCRSSRKTSSKDSAATYQDTADEMAGFINDEMSGTYTLDDLARRFSSPGSVSAHIWKNILRRLIDLGSVPPPQE